MIIGDSIFAPCLLVRYVYSLLTPYLCTFLAHYVLKLKSYRSLKFDSVSLNATITIVFDSVLAITMVQVCYVCLLERM